MAGRPVKEERYAVGTSAIPYDSSPDDCRNNLIAWRATVLREVVLTNAEAHP